MIDPEKNGKDLYCSGWKKRGKEARKRPKEGKSCLVISGAKFET